MAILNYKNKLKLILDVIFKPDNVIKEIEHYHRESIEKLTVDFTERLRMIQHDQYEKGIVNLRHKNQIQICKIPIVGMDKGVTEEINHIPNKVSIEVETKHTHTIRVSYMSEHMTTDEIKDYLALELSHKLITLGYIQTVLNNNNVVCSINAF